METSNLTYHLAMTYMSLVAFIERTEAGRKAAQERSRARLHAELDAVDLIPLTSPENRRW
ncbi:hypothetical protein [Streptomyces sp. PR69]|uniref:hypothetical protein n=1 Tax=Streptomyces sp. PR69 TaxID=2984950 RepID=UPI0022648AFE|nr:hypothetical protein [Streptomyces sp. PR69]